MAQNQGLAWGARKSPIRARPAARKGAFLSGSTWLPYLSAKALKRARLAAQTAAIIGAGAAGSAPRVSQARVATVPRVTQRAKGEDFRRRATSNSPTLTTAR